MRPHPNLVAIALAVAPFAGDAGAAPRAGKVVRIERRSHGLTGTPRYCSVHAGDLYGGCTGEKAPEVGERLTAIDFTRVIGVLRITSVTPVNDGCQETSTWQITAVVDGGDFSGARGQLLALDDVPLDSRSAHLVAVDKTPSGDPVGSNTIYAIDDRGDGSIDVEFLQFGCDDAGVPSNVPTGMCSEVWAPVNGKRLERIRAEHVKSCF